MHHLSFGTAIKSAPEIRPLFNMGCLMDVQCGRYVMGKYGESILNGGLARITGIGGRANTYKSTLAHFFLLQTVNRYFSSAGLVYDAELSMTRSRLIDLFSSLSADAAEIALELFETGRLTLTDAAVMSGDQFFDDVKKFAETKVKRPKSETYGTTPFVDKTGVNFKAMFPTPVEIDSLSRFPIAKVDDMLEENLIGTSEINMEAIYSSRAKHQMLIQLPVVTEEACMPFIMTAHVDDAISLDPRSPPQAKLAFLNSKLKFKYVPNQFLFLPNNLWYCFSAHALNNKTTKLAEFPYEAGLDDAASDLMVVTVQNLRGKYGASGVPYDLIVSQNEGLLVGLTEFVYCKDNNRYGIEGNNTHYYMALAPEIKLQRTTVRSRIRTSAKLQRVMEITSEMCQIFNLTPNIPAAVKCTPQELYDDLIAMGYDMDVLLNTRGYWIFKEDEQKNGKPFLSSMDLLRMRVGLYVPYWLPKEVKAQLKPPRVSINAVPAKEEKAA